VFPHILEEFNVVRKSINDLKADHHLILQGLDVLRELAEQLDTNDSVSRDDALDLLEFFRCFAHEYHDAKETFLVLPALAQGGVPDAAFTTIASDHCHIYTAIETLRDALIRRNDTEFVDLTMYYIELLSTHIFAEDSLLFDAMERILTDETDAALLKAFEVFETNLRDNGRLRFETIVRRLGRKYHVAVA
jgi:hemerythrin-like domain-containing protein